MRDAYALKALAVGEADKEQQLIALDWIERNACMHGDEMFVPESARLTDYVLGRRAVALHIGFLVKRKASYLKTRAEGEKNATESTLDESRDPDKQDRPS